MKKLILSLLLLIVFSSEGKGQDYSFLPEGLTRISLTELMSNKPDSIDLVYYEDGTRTTLKEAFQKTERQEVIPTMYVDKDGNYKALVLKEWSVDATIDLPDFPERLKRLGYSFGNKNSDTIVLYSDGSGTFFKTWLFEEQIKSMGYKEFENLLFINVIQGHRIDPDILFKQELAFDDAKKMADISVANLSSLIDHFKSKNKTVYLYGISFGAFVLADLISQDGIRADGYLVMKGRLDMNDEVWKPRSEGNFASFDKDAKTVLTSDRSRSLHYKNSMKISAAHGYKRYTELLNGLDLSKVIYVYGKRDVNVGALTQDEIDFLNTHGATVIASDGDHFTNMEDYVEIGLRLMMLE
jgi:hypothetical protein